MIAKYTCHQCGIIDAEVTVREREPGEYVGVWVGMVGVRARQDHAAKSPYCPSKTVDLMIPTMPGQRIGGPIVH